MHKKPSFIKLTRNIFALLFMVAVVSAPTAVFAVTANTGGSSDAVQAACEKLSINKKANSPTLKSCSDRDNLLQARTVATYHCDAKASDSEKQDCVDQKAISYFKKAAASTPTPKTQKDFDQALNKTLKNANGSLKTPAPGFSSVVQSSTQESTPNQDTTISGDGSDPAIKGCDNNNCDLVGKYINPAINLFSFAFGLVAVASLIMGGIQYSSSNGDPQSVSKAKKRIVDTIFAIVAYMFFYGFLQFLIPGGVF